MPDALRTAPYNARTVKAECDVSAGWEGIKTAKDADVAAARHSYLYLFRDSIGAVLDDVDFGEEGVVIYAAHKILLPKLVESNGLRVGDRLYWDPATRLVSATYDSLSPWIGMVTENADGDDLYVEADFFGHLAQVEA